MFYLSHYIIECNQFSYIFVLFLSVFIYIFQFHHIFFIPANIFFLSYIFLFFIISFISHKTNQKSFFFLPVAIGKRLKRNVLFGSSTIFPSWLRRQEEVMLIHFANFINYTGESRDNDCYKYLFGAQSLLRWHCACVSNSA